MDRKLWIIGDSFTMVDTGRYGENSWPQICVNHFKGDDYYVSSMGSRDIETVFDIFLEYLHKIKQDDFVILMLPTLTRFRLPLANPYVSVTLSNENHTSYNTNSMIGDRMYVSTTNTITSRNLDNEKRLEWPLSEIDPNVFQPNENLNEPPTMGNIMEMINSSKAFTDNWNLILKSIQSYVPFKLLYYSWTDELDASIVNTKSVINDTLGVWETLRDVWNETNGERGDKTDSHWSTDMNITFAEHIIKSYPQYFDYESKIL
jgi:hypothetical protein